MYKKGLQFSYDWWSFQNSVFRPGIILPRCLTSNILKQLSTSIRISKIGHRSFQNSIFPPCLEKSWDRKYFLLKSSTVGRSPSFPRSDCKLRYNYFAERKDSIRSLTRLKTFWMEKKKIVERNFDFVSSPSDQKDFNARNHD